MRYVFRNTTIIFPLLILLVSCRQRNENSQNIRLSDEQLIEINRELVIKERERIESYITRKGLDAELNAKGFWYSIISNGNGDYPAYGEKISLDYECRLLDGTLCYSTETDGKMEIIIGKSDIPTGLDAAVRIIPIDSEAIVILPTNLAFGLVGDGKRIPSRSALIYSFKISRRE